jgi:hypothetical protein
VAVRIALERLKPEVDVIASSSSVAEEWLATIAVVGISRQPIKFIKGGGS